ncbi:MAG: hypothetical protein JST61_13425 [Acidobacteria bacterium]|nr:hypothetical protein [Acidobacteriota bacterium]
MSDGAEKNSPASTDEAIDDARGAIGSAEVPVVAEEPKAASDRRIFGQNFLGITYMTPDFDDDLPLDMFDAYRDDEEGI